MITAEGEQKASRALREAAEVIAESTSALQVSSHLVILLNISKLKRLSSIINSCYVLKILPSCVFFHKGRVKKKGNFLLRGLPSQRGLIFHLKQNKNMYLKHWI